MLTDIFVPLMTYPDADDEALIETATQLCEPFAKGIEFTAFEVDIPSIAYSVGAEMVGVSAMIAEAEKLSRKHADRLLASCSRLAASSAVTSRRIRLSQDQVTRVATELAALHDMSIVQVRRGAIAQRELAEGMVFGSGRPVLVLPEARSHAPLQDHVAIAWDGGRAAARAVHDAMPLISIARAVTLITAFDDKASGERSIAGLLAYLSRHGIEARHKDVSTAGARIGTTLQDSAVSLGAGMLVMGAFGHSRIRDFVVGGATRSVLDHVALPVFLSH